MDDHKLGGDMEFIFTEDLEILNDNLRKYTNYIDRCILEGQLVFPPYNPTDEEEKEWNELGWDYDGFGTWARPGYHICRPGKIQKDGE